MKIFFLRHGDAELGTTGSDSDRRLTSEGVAEIELVARTMQLLKLNLTGIASSPFVRARQTADIITKKFPSLRPQTFEQLTPTAFPADLFRELLSFPRDSRILLVSHEPFISTCIGQLISGNNEPKISIKKGMLASMEVGSPVQHGAGVLLWLLPTEHMRLMNA